MPKACVSLWPTEECEWSSWDIWRSSDAVVHAIYLCLTFLLVYTFFVLIRFLLRYKQASRESLDFVADCAHVRNRKSLLSDLGQGLGPLKGISSSAPFFGLAGTSYGILNALWFSYSGSPERYVTILFTRIAFAFATSLAGILVATLAAVFHNVLRARIENWASNFSNRRTPSDGISSFHFAQTQRLKKRISSFPPFALLAAPTLACIVALFTPFHPYRVPTGLRVFPASFPCRPDFTDRIIVLQVMKTGELFINDESVSWADLPHRISDIYRARANREIYARADDGASFQSVADAIDIVSSIRDPEFDTPLGIKVLLITPQTEAENEKCFAIIFERLRRHSIKLH